MIYQTNADINFRRLCVAIAAIFCFWAGMPTHAEDKSDPAVSVAKQELSVEQLAQSPGVIFARALEDVPGRNLVVVALEFPPRASPKPPSQQCSGHRHPGSTYVYVTKGTMRLGIEGEPVRVVHAGESFFEPANALHTVAESASSTEAASAIAILILPEGAPILTPVNNCGKAP